MLCNTTVTKIAPGIVVFYLILNCKYKELILFSNKQAMFGIAHVSKNVGSLAQQKPYITGKISLVFLQLIHRFKIIWTVRNTFNCVINVFA